MLIKFSIFPIYPDNIIHSVSYLRQISSAFTCHFIKIHTGKLFSCLSEVHFTAFAGELLHNQLHLLKLLQQSVNVLHLCA